MRYHVQVLFKFWSGADRAMEFAAAIIFLLSFLTSLVLLLFLWRGRSRSNLPPGPVPFPIIGNLLELGEKPHLSLAKLAKLHGPLMSLQLGQLTSIVASSAEMAKEILLTHDQVLSNRFIPAAIEAHNHGGLALSWIPVSATWRNLRKLCQTQIFAAKALDDYQTLRRKKVQEFVDAVRRSSMEGQPVDLGDIATITLLNLLSNIVFSVDLADDPCSAFAGEFRRTSRAIMEEEGNPNISDYFPALKCLDIEGRKRRMELHMGKMLNLIDSMIHKRLKLQKNHGSSPYDDLLHCISKINEENSYFSVQHDQLLHLILIIFAAGTDTTASSIQWAMAELLRNPEIMKKAKAELREAIGKGNPVEESDIVRLPYLQAIVKEVMRLHPPAPLLIPRKSPEDIEIAGFTIPKDAQIVINVWAIGREPRSWENPDTFSPERFTGSDIDFRGRNFQLLPFGGGRRVCPGLPLAMRMIHLMLGSLVHLFEWELEGGVKPEAINMEEKFGITLEMAEPPRAIPLMT